jgi:hypothetical protein
MPRKPPPPRPPVEQYLAVRDGVKSFNNRLSAELDDETYDEALERLNMLNDDGTIGVNSDYDLFVVMDYAIYDVRDADGRNFVDRFAEQHAADLSPGEAHILDALRAARYDVLAIRKAFPGEGLEVESMLESRPKPFFLSDVSLGGTAYRDMILATRVVTLDGIHMTGGTALYPADPITYMEFVTLLTEWEVDPPSDDPTEFSAEVINLLLDAGSSAAMHTHDPRKPLPGKGPRRGKGKGKRR